MKLVIVLFAILAIASVWAMCTYYTRTEPVGYYEGHSPYALRIDRSAFSGPRGFVYYYTILSGGREVSDRRMVPFYRSRIAYGSDDFKARVCGYYMTLYPASPPDRPVLIVLFGVLDAQPPEAVPEWAALFRKCTDDESIDGPETPTQ